MNRIDLIRRAKAAGIHLLISAAVALLAAGLVFGVWYPGLYRRLAGGQGLFLLVVGVDVVMGPVLTFVAFNLAKGLGHLKRDLATIAALQLVALGYGLYVVHAARPIATVFERDRFKVISAAQVEEAELAQAPEEFRRLPLTGPWLLATRPPRAGAERNDALFKGIAGVDVAQRPLFWQPYEKSAPDAWAKARPVDALLAKYPDKADALRAMLAGLPLDPKAARFLPLIARGDWVVILDETGRIAGHFPVDGFF